MIEEKKLIGKEILTYRIESLIGKGGMGSVYLATNKYIDQKVAIKVLNANLADSPLIRQKFINEAKTLLALDHPNIVHFLNFVENEDGVFLIMEYVDGITLEEFIHTKNGLIVENRAYDMFTQILDAFAYAHKQGVIHRDIKPANIILTNDNEGNFIVKVLDFGIARIISESNDEEKGLIVGTPTYMSPEQVRGEEVDERSDIYSLGVLLHQMLTGHTPYDSTTLSETEIQKKVVEDPLPRMKEYFPYVSERMQKVVDKATAKNKINRYSGCAAFRKDFLPKAPIALWKKIVAVVLLLVLPGGAWWFYDYNYIIKTYYYKDYVEQWGVPIGIGKLSTTEFENRISSYRIEKLKGKVIRLSHVNNKGNIVAHNDSEHVERYEDMRLDYTENGKLNSAKRLDKNGKVLYIMRYDESLRTANFTHDDEHKTEITLSASTTKLFASAFNMTNEKSNISKYLLTYDDNGYLIELKYAGFRTSQACDNENIYGKKFIVDDKGRVIEEHYLGKDYTSKANKAGLAIKKLEYDENNDFVKVSYFAANGEPGTDGNGCHVCAIEYDKYGNRIKETYFDNESNMTLRKDCKIAGYNYIIENGFMVQQTAFDIEGKKCYIAKDAINEFNDIFGFATRLHEYDLNGYLNKITFLDTEDNKTIISTGITTVKFENDSNGNSLKQEFFDTENKLCENIYGYAKVTSEYDSRGNLMAVFYRNEQDSLCKTMDGTAGFRIEYDQNNRITKQYFLGTDNKPGENVNGMISIAQDYDKEGNLKKVTYLAADGKTLKLTHEDIAGWKSEYKDGLETERSFFDANEKLTAGNIGYAQWNAKYNENGVIKEESYFDKSGNPVVFYNLNTGFNYSKIEYVYDETHGNIIEEILYRNNVKTQILRYKFDRYDNLIERALFDGKGIPATHNQDWHKIVFSYNNQQQITEQRHYDTKGKLTLISDNVGKYAITKNEYDRMGRISRQTYFDENERPTPLSVHVPEGLTGYDKQGNMNYIGMADGSGKIIYNPQTEYAYQEMKHDMRGNITEERFYYADKKLRQKNHAISRYKYDKAGRLIENTLYNHQDKAAEYDGWHKYTMEYDEQGIHLSQKYYSLKNELVGTFKYNKDSAEWDFITDWRQYWRNSIPNCPFEVGYGVEVSSITLKSNGCELVVRFTGLSKYAMDNSEKEACREYASQFKSEKQNSQMPAGTQLVVIGVDKEKRELFRLTY